MPEILSKIPIGFNLEGYDFVQQSTETAPSVFGGVDATWEGGLVDDRWVSDESLKQVQVQVTNYQSAPLQYEADGKKYYGEARDGQDNFSDNGQARFSGPGGDGLIGAQLHPHDINDCTGGKLSKKLQTWAENLNTSEKGRKDFYCGVAIATKAVADYLNYFYKIGTDGNKVTALAEKKILCVEMLFNTMGSQGRAFRFKIVDCLSSGNSTAATKGTINHGQFCEYDVIDMMTPLLLLKDHSEIAYFKSGTLNEVVNEGVLTFPWASAGYNYKKAQIPGYGPTGIASLGLTHESKAGVIFQGYAKFKIKTQTKGGLGIARARYFVDQENAEIAKSVIPNLPDDFFRTNYADKGTAYFNISPMANYSSVGAKLADYGSKIMRYARYLRGKGSPMRYGGGGELQRKDTQPKEDTATVDNATGKYYIPMWRINNGVCDCDVFVNWVLLESGITSNASIGASHSANQWNANMLNQYLNPGYKAVAVPDITQAETGDILVYGRGKTSSHAAIFDSYTGGAITGYGFGTLKKASGNSTIPCGEPASSDLIAIIRIGQSQSA